MRQPAANSCFLVDASIYFFRSYFSLPDNWVHSNGLPVAGVYGYLRFLLQLLREQQPQHIAVAFDEALFSGFRHQLYPAYKCSRALPDEALAFQLDLCQTLTAALGVPTHASNEFEADDLLASLSAQAQQCGLAVVVVSADKDLAQLVQGDTAVLWDVGRKPVLDAAAVQQQLGVRPEQVADWLALTGDSSDDIPGVPGVGPKTAAALLQQFGSVDQLLMGLAQLPHTAIRGAARLQTVLAEHAEQLRLMQQLTTVRRDAPLAPPLWQRQAVATDMAEQLREAGLQALVRLLPENKRC